MEWSKDMTVKLIELYREKRVLWDPTTTEFKDRNKKHDAWSELAIELGAATTEVEKKVRMLIGQFQRELRKGNSAVATDSAYKSKWIYYYMLLFLKDKNEPKYKREPGLEEFEQSEESSFSSATQNEVRNEDFIQLTDTTKQQELWTAITLKPPQPKRSKKKPVVMAQETYDVRQKLGNPTKERDEFDVFGETVAHSLRNLQNKELQSDAKFHIYSLLYQAERSAMRTSPGSTPNSLFSPRFSNNSQIPSNELLYNSGDDSTD